MSITYAMNRIRVKPGTGAQLEERFQTRRGIDQAPGFLSFELLRGPVTEEYEEYLVLTRWESVEAYRAWTQSEAFRQAHSRRGGSDFVLSAEPAVYEVRIPGPQPAA